MQWRIQDLDQGGAELDRARMRNAWKYPTCCGTGLSRSDKVFNWKVRTGK